MTAEYRDKSFWLSQPDYRPSPPLEGDHETDVAIVGGGYTGLATAFFLKREQPGLRVTLVDAEVIGFGASGRNAGFSMTLFGLTLGVTALRFGKQRALEAHRYMEQAVDLVQNLVAEHHIDCDYEHPGFLRVATSPAYEKRIKTEIELAHSLGITGVDWLDPDRVAEQVRSPLFRGAWWEPRCGLVQPAKLAWGLKKLIGSLGVTVYERTPVSRIQRGERLVLTTPAGTIKASKLALATNAYSDVVPELRRKQVAVFTHIVLTEPLRDEQLREIGWQSRQGLEDARNLVHYYRLTPDNRLLMGGRSVTLPYGSNMDHDHNDETFRLLEQDIRTIFPALADVRITHRWGGPVSVPLDLAPALGYLGDKRVVYSLGCMGHGVSLTHLNGWTLADLLLERHTERTDVFFVNRRTIPWPPEPLRFVLGKLIKGGMDLQDRFTDAR
jgi:glycine/D-amino acid oxidase-like deaminating enzyme